MFGPALYAGNVYWARVVDEDPSTTQIRRRPGCNKPIRKATWQYILGGGTGVTSIAPSDTGIYSSADISNDASGGSVHLTPAPVPFKKTTTY